MICEFVRLVCFFTPFTSVSTCQCSPSRDTAFMIDEEDIMLPFICPVGETGEI